MLDIARYMGELSAILHRDPQLLYLADERAAACEFRSVNGEPLEDRPGGRPAPGQPGHREAPGRCGLYQDSTVGWWSAADRWTCACSLHGVAAASRSARSIERVGPQPLHRHHH